MALSVVGLAGVTNTEIRTHNADNQITSIGATNLVYDPNGNLQDDGVYNYTYDSENRLTGVTRDADATVMVSLVSPTLRTSAVIRYEHLRPELLILSLIFCAYDPTRILQGL